MNPEQNSTPEAELPTPSQKATTSQAGWMQRLKDLFNNATNISPSDAMMGTTAGRVMPEATKAAALQAEKNPQSAAMPQPTISAK